MSERYQVFCEGCGDAYPLSQLTTHKRQLICPKCKAKSEGDIDFDENDEDEEDF